MRKFFILLMAVFSICWIFPAATEVEAAAETQETYKIRISPAMPTFQDATYISGIKCWKKDNPDQLIDYDHAKVEEDKYYEFILSEAGEYEYEAVIGTNAKPDLYRYTGTFSAEEIAPKNSSWGSIAICQARFTRVEDDFYVNVYRVYPNENEEAVQPINLIEKETGGDGYEEAFFLLEVRSQVDPTTGKKNKSLVNYYRYELNAVDPNLECIDSAGNITKPEPSSIENEGRKVFHCNVMTQPATKYTLKIKAPKDCGLNIYGHVNDTAYVEQKNITSNIENTTDQDHVIYTFETPKGKFFDLVAGGIGTGYKRTVLTLPFYGIEAGETLEYTLNLEKYNDKTNYPSMDSSMSTANDLYTNVKNSYLHLEAGGSAPLEGFRMQQTTADDVTNYLVEPQMTFTPIYGADKITLTPGGGFGREYYTVTANKDASGIAILKVTYDELNVGSFERNEKDGALSYVNFPAIDESNIGIVVIDIGNDTSNIDTGLTIPGWEKPTPLRSDFDTVYIPRRTWISGKDTEENTNGTAKYQFKPPAGSTVRVHDPIQSDTKAISDSEWYAPKPEDIADDGTITLNLKEGRTIVEITNQGQKAYATIKGKLVDIQIENAKNPDQMIAPGDDIEVSFTGLDLPVYKMAGVYNPGYSNSGGLVHVKYRLNREIEEDGQKKLENLGDSGDLRGEHTQYQIATRNTVTFTVDKMGDYVLRLGQIDCPHLGSGLWAHTEISKRGKVPNLNAGYGDNNISFCILPDITFEVGTRVARVEAMIDALPLPDPENSVSCVRKIMEAKAAFDALKPTEKKQVDEEKSKKLNDHHFNVYRIIDVINKIDALPNRADATSKNLTLRTVEEIQSLYEGLETEEKKKAVDNYSPKMEELVALVKEIRSIENKITTLVEKGDSLSIADETAVAEARNAYDALDMAIQGAVGNHTELPKLEKQIAALKAQANTNQNGSQTNTDQSSSQTANDKKAADTVIAQIDAIGTITADNYIAKQGTVLTVRSFYTSLTDAQRALVTNLQTLEDAEAAIRSFQADEDIRDIITHISRLRVLEDGTPGPLEQENTAETWKDWEEYIRAIRSAVDRLTPERQDLVTNLSDLEQAEIAISSHSMDYVAQLIEALPDPEEAAQRSLTDEELQAVAVAANAYNALNQEEQARIPQELAEKLHVLEQKAQEGSTEYIAKVMEDFARRVDAYYSQNTNGAVDRSQLGSAQNLLAQYEAYPEEYRTVLDAMTNAQGTAYGAQMASLKDQIGSLEQQIQETEELLTLVRELPYSINADNAQDILNEIGEIERRYAALSEGEKSRIDLTAPQILKQIAQGILQEMETFRAGTVSNVAATAVSYQKIKVTWNRYDKATSYILQRRAGKGQWETLAELGTASYIDTSAEPGILYTYRVRALSIRWDDNGIQCAYGVSGRVRTSLNAAVLKRVKAYGKRSLTVTWKKVSGASGYEIFRSASKNGRFKKIKDITNARTLSFTNKKLAKNRAYYYKVRAYRKVNGKKVYSTPSAVRGAKTPKR